MANYVKDKKMAETVRKIDDNKVEVTGEAPKNTYTRRTVETQIAYFERELALYKNRLAVMDKET